MAYIQHGKSHVILVTSGEVIGHGYLNKDKYGNSYLTLYLKADRSVLKINAFERKHMKGKVFQNPRK